MRSFKKTLCLVLSFLMIVPFGILCASAADADYTLVSPYENVVWEGENAWNLYKGNMHTHSTYSDAEVTYPEMILEHYNQGFDFLAMTDHGITGRAWNEEQTHLALYTYQYLLGYTMEPLSDEMYTGITQGTLALPDGTDRDGMVEVIGGNEFNYITLTKSHVNGFFLPEGCGDGFDGGENGFEPAIAFIEENGGISHINHPGDWLDSNANPETVTDPANGWFFGEMLLKYPSCMGIEIFNCRNSTDRYNRVLWDTILMQTLPYGRTVFGFSNSDAHSLDDVDSSFMVFALEENNAENIKQAMINGAFFAVSRHIYANDIIGPETDIGRSNQGLSYPEFTSVKTDGHTVSVTISECDYIQWIADGKVIASQDLTEADCNNGILTLDLDTVDGAEDFLYVRAEIIGEGGMTCTQPIVIDNGSQKLVYEDEITLAGILDDVTFELKSTRIYCIFQELFRIIIDKINEIISK